MSNISRWMSRHQDYIKTNIESYVKTDQDRYQDGYQDVETSRFVKKTDVKKYAKIYIEKDINMVSRHHIFTKKDINMGGQDIIYHDGYQDGVKTRSSKSALTG